MRPFRYTKARSLAEAVQAVAAGGPDTRYLAGGTTLYDMMKLGIEKPTALVDITGIGELEGIAVSRAEILLGALARMSDVAAHRTIMRDYPMLSESLGKAASQQLRNMATIGGNLLQRTRCAYFRFGEPFACNKRAPGSGCSAIDGIDRPLALLGTSGACIANYPGDFAVALVALDAQVDVLGPAGTRSISIERFFREPGDTPHIETALAAGELITRVRIPATRLGRASTFHKIRDRESYAFALTSAAVALELDGDTVREARIAVGGVASRPWRMREAERALIGSKLTPETGHAAGELAMRSAKAGRHNGFRKELAARTIADALMIAKERA
ncbi:xanthine dehydrogenase family protein subunit M [Sphingomonas sp. HF-S4]|uniref:Xanthine dehydrogenase family protein subunit M n=1 Tax=Sphingomonas agrestis TaxID=3080540 RepID=A0ABU3Y489_9SPHN|nr:xanthine dehydrogenase family protein subunit M [Sphingomonas sp. HF-S4]MDV3456220.1 xanthine dehydrogenase family protein subunit M [Sphingomonas sp. HF-S4]